MGASRARPCVFPAAAGRLCVGACCFSGSSPRVWAAATRCTGTALVGIYYGYSRVRLNTSSATRAALGKCFAVYMAVKSGCAGARPAVAVAGQPDGLQFVLLLPPFCINRCADAACKPG